MSERVELTINPDRVELRLTTADGVEPATWRREPDRWVGPSTTPGGLDHIIEAALDQADRAARTSLRLCTRRTRRGYRTGS